jgi:hypothetical protein
MSARTIRVKGELFAIPAVSPQDAFPLFSTFGSEHQWNTSRSFFSVVEYEMNSFFRCRFR